MEIPIKYRIPLQGKYNRMCHKCLDCGFNALDGDNSTYDFLIGFADSNIGHLMIWECPKCFAKWSFHSRIHEDGDELNSFTRFMERIEAGKQKHFNSATCKNGS